MSLIIKFNVKDLINEYDISFDVIDLGIKINKDNLPDNIIHDESINKDNCTESFYEIFFCDSTLYFFIQSAIGRIKSLISRATHENNKNWHYSDIFVNEFYSEDRKDIPIFMDKYQVIIYLKEVS